MQSEHVNIHGHAWNPSKASITPVKKAKSEAPAEYHKGWSVEGIPPGALEKAQEDHQRVVAMAQKSGGKAVADFDRENWLMNARLKKVRSKPYEIPEAARECKALAEKAGWMRVSVTEVKRAAA